MAYNKKAVWRDISVRFLPETPEMKQTARGEEWDEPEGCGAETPIEPVISGDYVRRSDDGAHARRAAGETPAGKKQ